jgi:hypothetical protein
MTKNSDEMAFESSKLDDHDRRSFEEWVASEGTREKEGREGYFANNNNFTRDYWIAEKAWLAAIQWREEQAAEGFEEWQRDTDSLDCFTPLKEAWIASQIATEAKIQRRVDVLKSALEYVAKSIDMKCLKDGCVCLQVTAQKALAELESLESDGRADALKRMEKEQA